MSDQPVRGAAPTQPSSQPSAATSARANGGPVHSVPARPITPGPPGPPADPREARRAARARAWRFGKYSWLRRQWPLLLVLAVVAAALIVVVVDDFRSGTVLFAGAVLLAAVFRLAFPSRIVGLLVLRSRAMDVLTLSILGVAALVLALIVPDIR